MNRSLTARPLHPHFTFTPTTEEEFLIFAMEEVKGQIKIEFHAEEYLIRLVNLFKTSSDNQDEHLWALLRQGLVGQAFNMILPEVTIYIRRHIMEECHQYLIKSCRKQIAHFFVFFRFFTPFLSCFFTFIFSLGFGLRLHFFFPFFRTLLLRTSPLPLKPTTIERPC